MFFASLHGDSMTEYPCCLGHADEREASSLNFNANLPLRAGVDDARGLAALEAAQLGLEAFYPQLLILSLGVDTFVGDAISHFKLNAPTFARLRARLTRFGRPTLWVQEGGYATAAVGHNVLAELRGCDHGAAAA